MHPGRLSAILHGMERDTPIPPAAAAVVRDLRAAASAEKREVLSRFFRTGPGEYGEGDRFLGVMVPQIRAIAKAHAGAPPEAEDALLAAPWHEARECGLFLMVGRHARAGARERDAIHARYLAAAAAGHVDNWDLVDASAPELVGVHLLDRPRGLLYGLVRRPSLWENRIAIVATLAFIRRGDLDDAFRLSEVLLGHPHDLIHKAVGWMLRECGKRDPDRLRAFLAAHCGAMPRTTLRYAIERFLPDERRRWLVAPAGPRHRGAETGGGSLGELAPPRRESGAYGAAGGRAPERSQRVWRRG